MQLESLPGSVLDQKYRVERQFGKGAMGAVFQATHLGTTRPVALKVIVPKLAENLEFAQRFKREAEAAGRLTHPNVVNVTDFGVTRVEDRDLAYLVMEYLEGDARGLLERQSAADLQFPPGRALPGRTAPGICPRLRNRRPGARDATVFVVASLLPDTVVQHLGFDSP